MDVRQVVTNLLSTYSHRADEARLELFLALQILDRCGIFNCMWQSHQGRCCGDLPSNDNASICKFFQDFFWVAEDPMYNDDDQDLMRRFEIFLNHTLCTKHDSFLSEWATTCLVRLKAWRHRYVWNRFNLQSPTATTPIRSEFGSPFSSSSSPQMSPRVSTDASENESPFSRFKEMFRSSSQRLRGASKPVDDSPTPTAANMWGILQRKKTPKKSKRDSLGITMSREDLQDEELRRRASARNRQRIGLSADWELAESETAADASPEGRYDDENDDERPVVGAQENLPDANKTWPTQSTALVLL